jgi:glycosyltransferase involved in cell wall biosynthesis
MSNKKVVVIIPSYNAENQVGKVIKSLPRHIKTDKATYDVQPVAVEDGSRDNTAQAAQDAGAVVVRHIFNSGAGAATRTGLRYAQMMVPDIAYAVTIDSDGQHSSEDVEKLVRFADANNAQMVVGSRLHEGNKESMPFKRRLGNKGLSLISRVLFGITTKDTQSGLRLFAADVVPAVSGYTIDRYGFCTEMLWLAKIAGVPVVEVPIAVHYSERTLEHGQSDWGVVGLVFDLIWIRISR